MKTRPDVTLYLVTDQTLMSTETLEEAVTLALEGGCTLVQLREKKLSSMEFYQQARKIKAVCDRFDVPLIINDRADIALAVDAAGVHVGQNDLPCKQVRRLLGPDKIIGVSARTVEQAVAAERDGADYLGVGAMYATGTKTDASITTREMLAAIRSAVTIPIAVIGGISAANLREFVDTGVDGAAVVSAILSQKDIRNAARELKAIAMQLK